MIYDFTNVAPGTLIKDVERGLTLELVTQIDTSTGEITAHDPDDARVSHILKFRDVWVEDSDVFKRPCLFYCRDLLQQTAYVRA